jgi:hypothetical protein
VNLKFESPAFAAMDLRLGFFQGKRSINNADRAFSENPRESSKAAHSDA